MNSCTWYWMVLEDKEPIYLLCNKPAPLAKASLIIKIKKPQLLQNSKKKRIQKGTVIKLIFIILVKNKEHMSYHWAHCTHKSHSQAQTQRWQMISPQMNDCILPADKEPNFGQQPKLLLNKWKKICSLEVLKKGFSLVWNGETSQGWCLGWENLLRISHYQDFNYFSRKE